MAPAEEACDPAARVLDLSVIPVGFSSRIGPVLRGITPALTARFRPA